MITLFITLVAGLATGLLLHAADLAGWGWSTFFGTCTFVGAYAVAAVRLQAKVKDAMLAVQAVLADGQKKLEAKMARWRVKPSGSMQQMQAEALRETTFFVKEALAKTEHLHRFDPWVPLMKRQIATAQFHLNWMIRDYKKVDELMPKAVFLDPTSCAIKMARLQMLDAPLADIEKVYRRATLRARYNQNVLPAATWSWILLKRGDADAAFRALNKALEKSDDATLKQNRDHLANNRLSHFSNAGLGEKWYGLFLEEPRMHPPRQRMQWR